MDTDAYDALRNVHAKVQSSFLFSLLIYVGAYQESMESDQGRHKIGIQRIMKCYILPPYNKYGHVLDKYGHVLDFTQLEALVQTMYKRKDKKILSIN